MLFGNQKHLPVIFCDTCLYKEGFLKNQKIAEFSTKGGGGSAMGLTFTKKKKLNIIGLKDFESSERHFKTKQKITRTFECFKII